MFDLNLKSGLLTPNLLMTIGALLVFIGLVGTGVKEDVQPIRPKLGAT